MDGDNTEQSRWLVNRQRISSLNFCSKWNTIGPVLLVWTHNYQWYTLSDGWWTAGASHHLTFARQCHIWRLKHLHQRHIYYTWQDTLECVIPYQSSHGWWTPDASDHFCSKWNTCHITVGMVLLLVWWYTLSEGWSTTRAGASYHLTFAHLCHIWHLTFAQVLNTFSAIHGRISKHVNGQRAHIGYNFTLLMANHGRQT